MNEQILQKQDEFEIDIKRLFDALLAKAWLIAIVSVVCAILTFAGTKLLITPLYESSAMFYVNNNNFSVGDTSLSISSSDITASKSLVDSYIVILNSRACLTDVIDYAGVSYTYSELKEMLSASAVNDTEIFQVVVTSPDPKEAETIANAVAQILPKRISSIIEGTSAKIVDYAIVASKPSSPSVIKNTILGLLIGLVATAGIIVLYEIFDVTIRNEEDVTQTSTYPILAAVPDMMAPTKGGYYYNGEGKKSNIGKSKRGVQGQKVLVGGKIGFGAQEAYKLLRTKLQFSFADDSDCHVIGVSSALTGEGKSLSAANLAFSLSQLGKKVLLVDCDLRRPSQANKLPIKSTPGLSNYLTRQVGIGEIVQSCEMDDISFSVISAGRIPPNPIELLSSERMAKTISAVRKLYDYVILDLPPVEEVSDALAVAKLVDGILLVVRQNYCNRIVMANSLHQFEFVGAKILGVVLNCTTEGDGAYGRKYYKKYYKNYRTYEDSYETAARMAEMNHRAGSSSTAVSVKQVERTDEED